MSESVPTASKNLSTIPAAPILESTYRNARPKSAFTEVASSSELIYPIEKEWLDDTVREGNHIEHLSKRAEYDFGKYENFPSRLSHFDNHVYESSMVTEKASHLSFYDYKPQYDKNHPFDFAAQKPYVDLNSEDFFPVQDDLSRNHSSFAYDSFHPDSRMEGNVF